MSTYLCLDTNGKPLIRIQAEQGKHFIKNNQVIIINKEENILQFINTKFELKLKHLYGDSLNNSIFTTNLLNRCVVCGSEENLTRHHIMPQRYKLMWRKMHNRLCSMSSILCLCIKCHRRYERKPEPEFEIKLLLNIDEFKQYAQMWKDHFIINMQPKFLLPDWDILFTVG